MDGSHILLQNGMSRSFGDISFGGINGIWAKSYKKPFYITDEDVRKAALDLDNGNIDILITHGCPIGMADLTPVGTHGGQRCFADAFKTVNPKLYLCGHMHRKSSYSSRDGRVILNLGFAKEGDYSIITFQNGTFQVESKQI